MALKNILVWRVKANFELWESDRMPFEEILRRVKDQARAKKLEKDAQKGRSGINLGTSQANIHQYGQEFETWGGPANPQTESGSAPQELNSAQKGKDGKGKGKGKDGKGKGKGDGKKGGGKKGREPPKGGCFICGGKHWASECAQNALKKRGGQPKAGEQGRHLEEEMRLCCMMNCAPGKSAGVGGHPMVPSSNAKTCGTDTDDGGYPVVPFINRALRSEDHAGTPLQAKCHGDQSPSRVTW